MNDAYRSSGVIHQALAPPNSQRTSQNAVIARRHDEAIQRKLERPNAAAESAGISYFRCHSGLSTSLMVDSLMVGRTEIMFLLACLWNFSSLAGRVGEKCGRVPRMMGFSDGCEYMSLTHA